MDVAPLGAMTLIVPKYINMNLAPRAAAARSRPLSFPHKKTSILFMRRPSCPPLWYVTFDLGYCWRLSLTKETRQKLFPLSLMALYYFTAPKGYYVRTTTTFHSFLWACDFILAAFLSPNDTVSVVVPNGPYGTLWSGSFESFLNFPTAYKWGRHATCLLFPFSLAFQISEWNRKINLRRFWISTQPWPGEVFLPFSILL